MFNKNSKTEMQIVRVLGNSEGIISREQFLQLSNRTMLSRYISKGLLSQVKNAEKGVYQITAKFKREYTREIDPKQAFSGSGSLTHSTGLNTAISLLPKTSELRTGQAIKKDFESYRKTPQFKIALANLQDRYYRNLQEVKSTQQGSNHAYNGFILNRAENSYRIIMDERKAFSTPDIRATMTLDELRIFRDNLLEYHSSHKLSERKNQLLKETVSKLNQMERNYCSPVHVYIEIVTGSYGNVEIQQKENWADSTGNEVLFLSF